MKMFLSLVMFLSACTAFAGGTAGNGGSGSESFLVGQQAQLESVALKFRTFFLKNETVLKSQFPEFNIQTLIKKIKSSDIQVVDVKKLVDKHGKDRTCLNFPDSSLIECKSSGIELFFDKPVALFVLVLHEYLGLIGVEETSPENPTMIAGYSISKRIAPYVSKVNDYDLVIPAKTEVKERQTDERQDSWPAGVQETISLSNCFQKYNEIYNNLLEQRIELESEKLRLEHSASDLQQRFEIGSKLLGLNSRLLIMDRQMESGSRYSVTGPAIKKYEAMKTVCTQYGVELIWEENL